MASVAKWLRQWFVVPPFVGSSPIVRPYFRIKPTAPKEGERGKEKRGKEEIF
jgi:hypothetical protein